MAAMAAPSPCWLLMAAAELAAAEEEVRAALGFPVEAPARAALLVWVRTVVCWQAEVQMAVARASAEVVFFIWVWIKIYYYCIRGPD